MMKPLMKKHTVLLKTAYS